MRTRFKQTSSLAEVCCYLSVLFAVYVAQDPRSIRKCNGKGGIVKVAIMLVVFTTSKRKAVVWACETDDLEKEKMYNITIVQSGFRQTN